MTTLITGSFAYDTIMVFPDTFKNHILPEQVHILNVCFMVPEMRKEFGGCAGNIAYNLKLLGGDPLPMGTVGEDFGPYRKRLRKLGLDDRLVAEVPDTFTAQAFLTTDMDDNQIIAFHPGAMNFAHHKRIDEAENIDLGIVAPDGKDAMIQHAEQFAEAAIPFIFDPGQGLPMFDGEELLRFVDQASYVVVNDYESEMLQEKSGKSLGELAERVEALIVTRGGRGSEIYHGLRLIEIPTAPIGEAHDPTGCGDAYRAGLLYGIAKGLDWETTGRIASLLGAIKIEHHGTQNHQFDRIEFENRYKASFSDTLKLD